MCPIAVRIAIKEIDKLMETEIYFGEVLGKHSDVCGKLEKNDIKLFSDDKYVVSHVDPFGIDPLEYLGMTIDRG